MKYTVHQLSKLAGITVRTLHYYDQIGLLKPGRTEHNRYRRYSEDDLYTLQQILFFRELEFPLEDIKKILGDPAFDRIDGLKDHRKLLELKVKRLKKLMGTIEDTIKNVEDKNKVEDKKLYDSFSTDEVDAYAQEAKERWGHTNAYKESRKRVKKMGPKGLEEVKRKSDELMKEIVKAMPGGAKSPAVQKLILRHYEGLRDFYEPSIEMYRGLAEMYVGDPRFAKYYENYAPGLAVFMKEAMLEFVEKRNT